MSDERGMTVDEMARSTLSESQYAQLQIQLAEEAELAKIWSFLLPRRDNLNLSQAEVAARMGPGVDQSQVSVLEGHARRLDFDKITYHMTQKYAHALLMHVQLGLVPHEPLKTEMA